MHALSTFQSPFVAIQTKNINYGKTQYKEERLHTTKVGMELSNGQCLAIDIKDTMGASKMNNNDRLSKNQPPTVIGISI